MNVTLQDKHLVVTLSRRNVESLLAQLDSGRENFLQRSTESGVVVTVIPEEDDVHYRDREPGYPHKDRYK